MTTKRCRYCATEILAQAIVCPTCKNYQSVWRNNLLFAAGVAGFISLVGSAITFTVHQIAETYKQVHWRENLNVLELQTGPAPYLRIVLSNGGDGPVFASLLVVYWQGGNVRFPIDRAIPVNSIETIDNLVASAPESPISAYDSYATNRTGVPSARMLENAEISNLGEKPKKCFLASIFDANNADLQRMKEYHAKGDKRLLVGKAEASIFFFSAHTGARFQSSVPVVAVFLGLATTACQQIPLD